MEIALSFIHADGDVDFLVYDQALNYLGGSTGTGNTESFIIPNTTTSPSYYVQVYGYNGAITAFNEQMKSWLGDPKTKERFTQMAAAQSAIQPKWKLGSAA